MIFFDKKKKTVVMVVDDSPTALEMNASILKIHYAVEKASSGNEAIKKAMKIKPSVIVLDANMPEIDGWEVCKILKSNPATQKIKIIMCTGASKGEEVERAFGMGADGYIIKPVVPNNLLEKIKSLL